MSYKVLNDVPGKTSRLSEPRHSSKSFLGTEDIISDTYKKENEDDRSALNEVHRNTPQVDALTCEKHGKLATRPPSIDIF